MSQRDLKMDVWKRDGVRCRYCGLQLRIPPSGRVSNHPLDATVDHVVPRAKGGRSIRRNLLTSCKKCNFDKGAQDALAYHVSKAVVPVEPVSVKKER